MGGINIKVENLDQTLKSLDRILKDQIDFVEDELNNYGQLTVNKAKELCPVNEGHLKNSITFERKGLEVEIIVNSDYAAYVEFGTGKFAKETVGALPKEWQEFAAQFKGKGGGTFEELVERITRWVKLKGIGAERTKSGNVSKSKSSVAAQEQAAYAIALSIVRNGIHAHPFLYPAVIKGQDQLIKNLKANL